MGRTQLIEELEDLFAKLDVNDASFGESDSTEVLEAKAKLSAALDQLDKSIADFNVAGRPQLELIGNPDLTSIVDEFVNKISEVRAKINGTGHEEPDGDEMEPEFPEFDQEAELTPEPPAGEPGEEAPIIPEEVI